MPFTLAHPAAVLFLRNKYFNFSALILGSMSPDFIYFLLFKPISNLGHTLIGFLCLNLQLCFLVYFLFECCIKEAFIMNLPNKLSKQYRFLIGNSLRFNSIKSILIFIYSALLGMFTHIVWDGFTHKTGYFVERIRILRNTITIINYNLPIYKLLQHISSIIGILLIFLFIYTNRNIDNSSNNLSRKAKFIYYSIVLFFSILITLLSLIYSLYIYKNIAIGTIVISPLNGFFIGLLFGGLYYKIHKKDRNI